jgi:hypothetical protein
LGRLGREFLHHALLSSAGQKSALQSSNRRHRFRGGTIPTKRRAWYAHLVVLMPDHLHALVSFSREVAMKKTVSNFKEFVAKQCGIQWQRDFFDHRLRADESYDEKASYIRMNPVRQQLVATPEAWPYVWEPR